MFRNRLGREVATIVVVKTALIVAAALFVFGPKQRPLVDPAAVQTLLLAAPTETSSRTGP